MYYGYELVKNLDKHSKVFELVTKNKDVVYLCLKTNNRVHCMCSDVPLWPFCLEHVEEMTQSFYELTTRHSEREFGWPI